MLYFRRNASTCITDCMDRLSTWLEKSGCHIWPEPLKRCWLYRMNFPNRFSLTTFLIDDYVTAACPYVHSCKHLATIMWDTVGWGNLFSIRAILPYCFNTIYGGSTDKIWRVLLVFSLWPENTWLASVWERSLTFGLFLKLVATMGFPVLPLLCIQTVSITVRNERTAFLK